MKLFTYVLTALFAGTALTLAAPTKDEMMTKEKAAWQAYKDKDAAAFKKYVDTNIRAVYSDGINSMEKELEGMKTSDMRSFTINDYNAVPIGTDTIVTTYTVDLQATVNGRDASGTFNAGSVWKNTGGDWKAIFHTQTKAEPAGSASVSPSP